MALNLNLDELLGDSGGSSGAASGDHGGVPSSGKDLFAVRERRAWRKGEDSLAEARCDFTFRPRLVPRMGLWFFALWQKSVMGRTLTDIKSDDAMVDFFAREVGQFLLDVLRPRVEDVQMPLDGGGWALVTSPKRRHKERNFATRICQTMAPMLGVPFYEDAACCHSRHRMNAVFEPGNIPEERNVIVFDDFVTTGQTMRSMVNLLAPYGKNLLLVTGINNKL